MPAKYRFDLNALKVTCSENLFSNKRDLVREKLYL